jgi:hypothetical protein
MLQRNRALLPAELGHVWTQSKKIAGVEILQRLTHKWLIGKAQSELTKSHSGRTRVPMTGTMP